MEVMSVAEIKLLIADDDPNECETLSDIFQEKGYSVATACTGNEAIDKVKKTEFNVALIDIRLPDMDGVALLKEFKTLHPGMVCIIITGYAALQNAVSALKEGANGYFSKPLIIDEVILRVEEALDKQHLQRELRESEEKYSTLVESSKDGIIMIQDGVLKFINTAATELVGYSIEEMINANFLKFVAPVYRDLALKRYNDRIEGRKLPSIHEIEILRKDGKTVPVEINSVLINIKGKATDLAFIRDITERKKAEEEERTEKLKEAIKELESFSYSVSHDLRAPLRAINGFSKIILEDKSDKLDAECKRLLNNIRRNTQNMGQLIDDLLNFSRIGRHEIKQSNINMHKLAKNVFEELKSNVPGRTLKFNIKTLPPARGDQAMIREVFVNLLSNAIKFTRLQKAAVIEISSRIEDKENIYCVKDNGIGFDMKYVGKLFGVFQRLHSVDEFEGTGVGLAIVQRIIHKHAGRVWAEAGVNEGATFYFTLPKNEIDKEDS